MNSEEFKIRLDWDKMSKDDLRNYLFELHSYLLDFSTSSIVEMILALDDVARIITDDLNRIVNNDDAGLRILTDDKDSKSYERVMSLVDKVERWRSVANYAKELRPSVVDSLSAETKENKVQKALASGGYEEVQRRIKAARGLK